MQNQNIQDEPIWEDVLTSLRRHRFKRNKQYLSASNNSLVADAYTLWCVAIYDLLTPFLGYRTRIINQFAKNIMAIDMIDMVSTLKAADKLLLTHVSEPLSYESFKQILKVEYPAIGTVMAPMKEKWHLWASENDPQAFADIHLHLAFISRLNLPDLKDLETDAMADYLEIEASMQTEGFTSEEATIIQKWFPISLMDEMYDNFRPTFGPGAVSDIASTNGGKTPPSRYAKYHHMKTDTRIHQLMLRLGSRGRLPDLVGPQPKLLRQCKVIFVPKSIDKLRTISSEPTTLSWFQQGFSKSISKIAFENKRHYLSRRVDLKSQEKSRNLAYEGSLDGSYATIDLSAASDRISWNLIKQWFGNSCLARPIYACRSEEARLGKNRVLSLKKYAPMGSALTFPIQCIVFSAIVEAAIQECGGRARDSSYCVYGDDIIVESHYAPAVIRRLSANGFLVNTKKSFWEVGSHNFRESCGGEYLDGFDVTPIRLSRKFSGLTIDKDAPDQSRIVALIDLCNTTFSRLPSVRLFVIHQLNKLSQTLKPLFDDSGSKGIFSLQPTNFQLRDPIWNTNYQIWEILHGGSLNHSVSYDDISQEAHEVIRYFEWLRTTQDRLQLVLPQDRVEAEVLSPGNAYWTEVLSRCTNVTFFESKGVTPRMEKQGS